MKDICGVYSLVNLVTGERYIGSSISILKRCKDHFNQLKNGRHKNRLLSAGYRQHGCDAFVHEILKEVEEPELAKWEQHYIDRLRPAYNQIDIVERQTNHIEDAEQWLREQLADGQPHIAGVIILRARQRGMKTRSVQLARQNIGAITKYMHKAGEYAWHWQLPVKA